MTPAPATVHLSTRHWSDEQKRKSHVPFRSLSALNACSRVLLVDVLCCVVPVGPLLSSGSLFQFLTDTHFHYDSTCMMAHTFVPISCSPKLVACRADVPTLYRKRPFSSRVPSLQNETFQSWAAPNDPWLHLDTCGTWACVHGYFDS